MMYKIRSIQGIEQPAGETMIMRVFSKDKYSLLLENEELWFSSIDLLKEKCDPLERNIPDAFFQRMTPESEEFYKAINQAMDEIYKSFVSCWSHVESKKLWDTYDPEHNGFALISTCQQVLSAIGQDCFFACKVKYLEQFDTKHGKSLGWVLVKDDEMDAPSSIRVKEQYKDGEFVDDQEIRFIGYGRAKDKGINIKVSIKELVTGAIINPYASVNTKNELRNTLEKNSISIIASSLSIGD